MSEKHSELVGSLFFHERCSYGQQDLLHVYTLKIYICSLNNLIVCLLLFVLLKTYKKAHKFTFQKSG